MNMGWAMTAMRGAGAGWRADGDHDGRAYATSAEIAGELGPFAGFARNRQHMLRVIRNHRRAAHGHTDGYEGVNVNPRRARPCQLPRQAARADRDVVWDEALALGEKHGFRNAQATVIAPDGGPSVWSWDCDTTGIEPDFALVKFKKLAGGGYFKIINQSVPAALRKLGYPVSQIEEIVAYAVGHKVAGTGTHINRTTLLGHGFGAAEIAKVEAALPQAFDIRFVFNQWTLGEEFCAGTLGIPARSCADPSFNLLQHLGFTKAQIDAANDHVCGTMTLEGAPHLKAEHLPVFDCANPCGKTGKRYLSVESHITMMAAAQSFISGAISKTINMPNSATIEDCLRAYELSWSLGIKANSAVSGRVQAVAAAGALWSAGRRRGGGGSGDRNRAREGGRAGREDRREDHRQGSPGARAVEDAAAAQGLYPEGDRRRAQGLPEDGEYADGSLGEIFIDMHKEGAGFRAMMNNFAIAVSVGLQYACAAGGVRGRLHLHQVRAGGHGAGERGDQAGDLDLDYIFRELAISYLDRTDLAHVKPEGATFDDIGRGEAEGIRNFAPVSETAASSAIEVLKQISRPGICANRMPQAVLQRVGGGDGLWRGCRGGGAGAGADDAQRHRRRVHGAVVGNGQPVGPRQGQDAAMRAIPAVNVGNYTLVRNGTCMKCNTCGGTSGCS